ncbi:M16 family metallopeptidase [Lapidilactobacillus mulanensis]|uniref:M16 family metallopeptidase n=1 Tax=Lapidilactobacillus mulanensis TaxID=2485999 RepID=A0ABW4DR10_9LACO|nr:insulinase family protein [Lapidilactobacillus mulanensis]
MKTTITTGVEATISRASKFRTNMLTCHFVGPIDAASNTEMTLLTWMLAHGCQKYPQSDELSLVLAQLYGANLQVYHQNYGRWRDLVVEISFVDPQTDGKIGERCLDLIKQIIFEPLIGAAHFGIQTYQSEYQALKTELLDLQTDHDFQTYALTKDAFFDETELKTPRIGNLAELAVINYDRLVELYQRILQHWQIELVDYGQNLPADAQLSDWSFAPRQVQLPEPQLTNFGVTQTQTVTQEVVGEQTHLSLAYSLPDLASQQARDVLRLWVAILGGDEQSLLFRQVREQSGLAYDIGANYDSFLGWLVIEAGVDRQQTQAAQADIALVLQTATEKIDPELLALEKENLINEQLQALDQPRTRSMELFADALFPERQRDQADFARAIRAITAEQVMQIAGQCHLKVVTELLNQEDKK